MKHVLPLTYEPKIADVRDGFCTQTIRLKSESKPKKIGDFIMFHGWEGVSRHSKWSWRTPYMKITDAFSIRFLKDTSNNTIVLLKEIPSGSDRFHRLTVKEADKIACLDGFATFERMVIQLKKMYGKEIFTTLFQVIRWNPYKEGQLFEESPEKDCSTRLDDWIK